MSEQVAVARVNATGALIPLNDNNRPYILTQPGNVETVAERHPETGRLTEINGGESTTTTIASKDLQRIGEALAGNLRQREQLLTAALKLHNAQDYLVKLGVYKGEEDEQFIDPQTLGSNSFKADANTGVLDVTEQLAQAKASQSKSQDKRKTTQRKKPDSKADSKDEKSSDADLSEL